MRSRSLMQTESPQPARCGSPARLSPVKTGLVVGFRKLKPMKKRTIKGPPTKAVFIRRRKPGGGRKHAYGEPTVKVGLRLPVSLLARLRRQGDNLNATCVEMLTLGLAEAD